MKPLCALLMQASGLLFAGLAIAAPQHAVTLYNEPPKYPAVVPTAKPIGVAIMATSATTINVTREPCTIRLKISRA